MSTSRRDPQEARKEVVVCGRGRTSSEMLLALVGRPQWKYLSNRMMLMFHQKGSLNTKNRPPDNYSRRQNQQGTYLTNQNASVKTEPPTAEINNGISNHTSTDDFSGPTDDSSTMSNSLFAVKSQMARCFSDAVSLLHPTSFCMKAAFDS
jgi:hypothetical protein